MADPSCPLCAVVAALETRETFVSPDGQTARRVAVLPASVAILGADQFYQGYTLVIGKRHATELYHLPDAESTAFFQDMLRVARAIDRAFSPRKMNYELLGNTVAHLHWHLFPRYAGDPNPSRPTWEHTHEPTLLDDARYAATIVAIRRHLGVG
jgi:diadenosine tetraphosphate (Ap4A) HIT family hydrolase